MTLTEYWNDLWPMLIYIIGTWLLWVSVVMIRDIKLKEAMIKQSRSIIKLMPVEVNTIPGPINTI